MQLSQAQRLAVLIPAYRPSDSLLEVVRALVEKSLRHIVVVDDSSGPDFRELFGPGEASLPGVANSCATPPTSAKAWPLQTGLNYALCKYPDLIGIVTADGRRATSP